MSDDKLGRLEKVDLRTAWKDEGLHFTPWLAKEENLQFLAETLGMHLELVKQEKEVGPFRADILCKNLEDDSWVLIENQLERTDHTHLGQILTYAAGLEAVTAIWIAERFTEEHRAALDWLNEHTDEKISFLGLEVELWRIGDSPVAPKFNIVAKPNDWTREVPPAAPALIASVTSLSVVEYAGATPSPLLTGSILNASELYWFWTSNSVCGSLTRSREKASRFPLSASTTLENSCSMAKRCFM